MAVLGLNHVAFRGPDAFEPGDFSQLLRAQQRQEGRRLELVHDDVGRHWREEE